MDNNNSKPSETALLAEYKEAMESQRSNTQIAYSWMGTIFLAFSTGLFYYGTRITDINKMIPTMILALILAIVWWGLTETFIFYIRQRMKRIHEIEAILNLKLMSAAGKEIRMLGFKSKFLEARNYVRFFILMYIIVWIILFILNF